MRGNVWYVQKQIRKRRIRESCGTGSLAEAEKYLAHRIETIRQAAVYGVRPRHVFREAATRYVDEATKRSIKDDILHLRLLQPFIGDLFLEDVHMGTLQPFIQARKAQGLKKGMKKGVKNRTVNFGLQVVRHVLNLAASEWIDDGGQTWLAHAPKIKLLREDDKRDPYPLSWGEQARLFAELPQYLERAALFAVNTGCRDQEVCNLLWEWEVAVPALETSVFILPGPAVKNRMDRLVVLNRIASAVIEEKRGEHPTHVFSCRGRPLYSMYGTVWKNARERAGLPQVRVHDLKHTFGRRLRAAGVSFEDRQDLLGHKSARITTHYSRAELANLIAEANKVCEPESRKSPALVILKKKSHLAVVA